MELIDTVGTGFEYEYESGMPPNDLCLIASANSSTVGPGLDSDFGASAGKWLHFSIFIYIFIYRFELYSADDQTS